MGERPPAFVQPPWVWGPSEVNAWIDAVHPSKGRRPSRRIRRTAPSVGRLRVRVLDATPPNVREAVVAGLAAIGFSATGGSSHRVTARRSGRKAVASIHHSLLWRGIVVSVLFHPPIRRSASRHLLHLFTDRFRLVDVSADE